MDKYRKLVNCLASYTKLYRYVSHTVCVTVMSAVALHVVCAVLIEFFDNIYL